MATRTETGLRSAQALLIATSADVGVSRVRTRFVEGGRVRLLGFPISRHALLAVFVDALILGVSVVLGFMLRTLQTESGHSKLGVVEILDQFTGATGFVIISSFAALYLMGTYNIDAIRRRGQLIVRILLAMALASALSIGLFYARPSWKFGRGTLLNMMLLATILVTLWRLALARLVEASHRARRLLIAGAGWCGRELVSAVQRFQADYAVVGYLDDKPELQSKQVNGIPVLGTSDNLMEILSKHSIDEVAVAVSNVRSERFLRNIFRCKVLGTPVTEMPDLYKMLTYKVPIKHVTDQWFILGGGFDLGTRIFLRNLLRLLDIGLSAFGLALAAPILALAALLIKLTSPGPVFFRQQRVGQYGVEFDLFKLRTMVADAEATSGPVWAQKNDPRVTPVGRWLRRTRIDEIPQLINVLRGEMSLVGPRPERAVFVAKLSEQIPYFELRHMVKPGVTGWAQVNYQYTNDEEGALEKLQYDLFYIQEMSLFLYLLTLLKTVRTVLAKPGS